MFAPSKHDTSTQCLSDAGPALLGQRRRWWANISQTLGGCVVFAGTEHRAPRASPTIDFDINIMIMEAIFHKANLQSRPILIAFKNHLLEILSNKTDLSVIVRFCGYKIMVARGAGGPSKPKTFAQHMYNVGPASSTLVQHCTNVIQMFCVCWGFAWLTKKTFLNFTFKTQPTTRLESCPS